MRLLLILAILAPSLSAQDCSRCGGQGLVECRAKGHDPKRVCGVQLPHRCRELRDAECCGGCGLVLCEGCGGTDAARKRLAEAREDLRCRLDEVKEIDVAVGARFAWVGTDAFDLYYSISEWKVDRKKLLRSVAAHRFAVRAQAAADRWLELTGLEVVRRPRLVMMENVREMDAACLAWAKGMKARFSLLLPGEEGATWLSYPFHEGLYEDEGLHSHLVHNVCHVMFAACGPFRYRSPGWLDVGLAHLVEAEMMRDLPPRYHTWCAAGGGSQKSPWADPKKWPKLLREARRKEPVRLADLAATTLFDIKEQRQHVQCWAWARYLAKKHAKALGPLLVALKETGDTEQALVKSLGFGIAEFERRAGRR